MDRAIPKREALLAFLLAFLACLLWTWPMALGLGEALPYDPRFSSEAAPGTSPWVWQFWWVGQAVAEGLSPFECPWVSWPFGESLAWREGAFGWALLTLPIERLWGPVVAFQLASWLRLTLAGGLAYLVARQLRVGPMAAAVGSLAWTFGPASMASLVGRWPWMASPELPGVMLVLLAWKHSESSSTSAEGIPGRPGATKSTRARVRGALLRGSLLGAWVGFAALNSIPGAALTLLGAGAVFALVPADLWEPGGRALPVGGGSRGTAGRSRVPARLAGLLAAGLACTVLAGPRFRAMDAAPRSGLSVADGAGLAPSMDSVDALDFYRPPGRHPMFTDHYGSAIPRGHGDGVLDMTEGLVDDDGIWQGPRPYNAGLYLGLALSTLTVLGLGLDPVGRRLGILAILLALAMVEPLGFGVRGSPDSLGGMLMPFTARAQGLLVFLLALVAARSLAALGSRPEGRWGARILVGVLLFEVWTGSIPMAPLPRDPLLERVGEATAGSSGGEVGAVLALHRDPGNGAIDLLLQMRHGQPITHSFLPFPDQRNAGRWTRLGPGVLRALMGELGAPRELERELELLGVSHLIAEREWLEGMPLAADVFDSMARWERAESSAGEEAETWAWWYPSSLLYR